MAALRRSQRQRSLSHRIDKAEKVLDDITEGLVQALEDNPTVHRLDDPPFPNTAEIRRVRDDLLEITSPGYGQRQQLRTNEGAYFIGNLVAEVRNRLITQVTYELRLYSTAVANGRQNHRAKARKLVDAFLRELRGFIQQLAEDLEAMKRNDPAALSRDLILASYPGLKAIRTYRFAHKLHGLGLPNIARIMSEIAHSDTDIDIHPGAKIGREFAIDHGSGTVIGETTVIGDKVVIYQGVTLGARKFEWDEHHHVLRDPKQRHPTIGNDVIIYANATIMGGDTVIGDRTIIAAGAMVRASVEADMIVWPGSTTQTKIIRNGGTIRAVQVEEFYPVLKSDTDWFQLYLDSRDRIDDN
jgi:serine O-acetyltransferase